LVEGRIYSIRWCAVNQKGQGPWSEEILVAFTDFPNPPTLIEKIPNLSSKTAITVTWNEAVPGLSLGGQILGYKLIVRNPNTADEWIAFDGQQFGVPEQTQFTVYGLQTGTLYEFSVLAINFNGDGQESTSF
jgi:hypothetical protein